MPASSYFFVNCPTCGRSLQVRVAYLGRSVVCQHCHGKFVASDPSSSDSGSMSKILARADELLHTLDVRTTYPR